MKLFAAAIFCLISLSALAADPLVPDPKLTPGRWHIPPTPLPTLCTSGYTKTVRNVPESVKNDVFRRYGYDPRSINRGSFEIDHFVPLVLDGVNDIENLWPQSYVSQPMNARRKDVLEDALHRQVCSGRMSLHDAQVMISTDWIDAYNVVVLHGKSKYSK